MFLKQVNAENYLAKLDGRQVRTMPVCLETAIHLQAVCKHKQKRKIILTMIFFCSFSSY